MMHQGDGKIGPFEILTKRGQLPLTIQPELTLFPFSFAGGRPCGIETGDTDLNPAEFSNI